jgi:hypothetical protein
VISALKMKDAPPITGPTISHNHTLFKIGEGGIEEACLVRVIVSCTLIAFISRGITLELTGAHEPLIRISSR